MKHDIYRWIFHIPLKDIREDGYDETGNENPCICCGKQVKNERYYVHLLTDGNLVSTDQPITESQGFFSIGAACRKKLPNNFVFDTGYLYDGRL